MSRTYHCTPENDNTDDKARHATPTAEMHCTILDASTASHAKPTIAKKLRIKRGSHPAARRQRKCIAAARAAAAVSESPPRLEETKSEQYNPSASRWARAWSKSNGIATWAQKRG